MKVLMVRMNESVCKINQLMTIPKLLLMNG